MCKTALTVLSVDEMRRADAATIKAGTPSAVLMERAGAAVAHLILSKRGRGRAMILEGPGNNGGDGRVIARLLKEEGWEVDTLTLTSPKVGQGPYHVIIDALFGVGLSRPLEGQAHTIIETVNAVEAWKVAVDLPSGVDGDSGAILGTAFHADDTVTFAAKKPGHLLYPGRGVCGRVRVADIGIGWDLETPPISENGPTLFKQERRYAADIHKYNKGHALVLGGPRFQTGAARLCAEAALRGGAGLVTIVAQKSACDIYAAHMTSVMLTPCETAEELGLLFKDERIKALALGPGMGVTTRTRDMVFAVLKAQKAVVLDADALSVFEDTPERLWSAIQGPVVLTPHEGEFRRLFPDLLKGSKIERVRHAARRCGAVVVLKGADTVIADPEGFAIVNTNAPSSLATAGSGDVLAGVVLSGLSQGLSPLKSAARGVYIHGALGQAVGAGCIAEDLLSSFSCVKTLL